MKTQTCFKVTTSDCRSVIFSMNNGRTTANLIGVTYSTEHFTVPKLRTSALFCFATLERAERYVRNITENRPLQTKGWAIWEAEAINMRPKKRALPVRPEFCLNLVEHFWVPVTQRARRLKSVDGHFVADAIRLVKIVS